MHVDDLTLGFTGCGYGEDDARADLRARGIAAPPDDRPRTRAAAMSLSGLLRTIEGDIVPRLVLARCTALPAAGSAARSPTREEVEELVGLLLAHESGVALAFVAALHARGMPLDTLCLELLAPAARRIGELWEHDRADIMQVSLALARLHTVLREVSVDGHEPMIDSHEPGARVLLVPSPGEQHTFGLMLVAEFFRRAGWDVSSEFPATTADLLELVAGERFAVVGLSCASESRLDGLASRIQAVRRASRNRGIGVLVGGRLFTDAPELAGRIGADGTAADGRQAVLQARRLRGLLVAAH
ncbi:MAG: cobalamin B12-binding domain-containing protein [Steroidobacteraceae bacterium]|jgi:methanogenic corrinoid protein MtbC1|nr:cobalamin B12-binding domain-containing protein [Steroidobacteraceae bacterium]